ncbi:MAG TPA: hypothetical protein VGI86_11625 [Acidimicrobiia bacterium]|nr:hypothetical protein [Kofleriaceae bacterium]
MAAGCAACHGRAPIATCDDDLGGTYRDPSGATWMILDDGASLEAYPLFDDFHGGSDAQAAPRAIDVARPRMDGEVHRRYTRGAQTCNAHAPVRVTACRDDRLELVIADPPPPLTYQPCASPPGLTHVERWLHD